MKNTGKRKSFPLFSLVAGLLSLIGGIIFYFRDDIIGINICILAAALFFLAGLGYYFSSRKHQYSEEIKMKKRFLKKILKMTGVVILSLILLIIIIMSLGIIYTNTKAPMKPIEYESTAPDYFPTQIWQTSAPEEQGIDSAKLIEMIEFYENEKSGNDRLVIDSVTIIRNGYIVSDIYFDPLFSRDTKHILHSVTKSIMSALIGIAIDKGHIESVDVPVTGIFKEKNIDNSDDRINNLTIRHLLTMQTGLRSQDSYLYQYKGLFEAQKTNDWTEYALNLPFEKDPGTRFEYSNLASFLLSALITESSGMDTLSFAKEHLFNPLGIEDVQWEKSPKGIGIGWARMWLKPHDMAKIGLLYLQKGKWENEQVISSEWIEGSIEPRSFPKKYRYVYNEEGKINWGLSGGEWTANNLIRPFADGYGYQWWLDKTGMYSAVGTGGQYIIVVPKENLVVVFTGKLNDLRDSAFPIRLLKKYILPAIISNEPLSSNEKTQKELERLSLTPPLISEAKTISKSPIMAQEISGKTYDLDSNRWKYDNFKLIFDPNKDNAEFSYDAKESDFVNYLVGLDNVYKFTQTNNNTYAAVGYWKSENNFIIEYEIIGYSNRGDKWSLTFSGDKIYVEEVNAITGTTNYSGETQ